ncbi:hypothetical protein [Nocardioides sp.]|uniref:hypothetical protein n=1 Tax=Nocardioides sp. TaxID=35761 RepID=UPI002B7FEE92|nr:hypothetical protein [Nocardioides sp.]HSX67903.1 hypothetical protein [Nocardioides sp.]
MNDLDLLDTFGPSAVEPSDTTLAAARARLAAAIDAPSPAVRRTRRLPLLVAASVVAAGAVGVAVTPALVGSDDSIALAAVDPLTFPWTPATVPAGLGDPVFDKDLGHFGVVYGESGSGFSIFTQIESDWDLPSNARDAEVNGEPAKVFERERNGAPAVTVAWEDDTEGETWVTGSGPYAEPDTVLSFVEALREKPQPVDLSLTVAPSGWMPTFYKADRILTLTQSGEYGPERLTVALLDQLTADFAGAYAATGVERTTIDGRPATFGQQETDGGTQWVLEATARDGQPFQVQAPGALTEAQLLGIAAGVRHR